MIVALCLALAGITGGVGSGGVSRVAAADLGASGASNRAGVTGEAIVHAALQYVGTRYRANGKTPKSGFDPIGFVTFVYRTNGIALPRTIKRAFAFAPEVPVSDLKPGDILYFKDTVRAGLSHVGIYVGNGTFIHAEWYHLGVRITSLQNDEHDGNYWIGKYVTANRPAPGDPV